MENNNPKFIKFIVKILGLFTMQSENFTSEEVNTTLRTIAYFVLALVVVTNLADIINSLSSVIMLLKG